MSTIAAISTPNAAGGIGIVRLSGEEAIAISEKCFRAYSGKPVSGMKGYTAAYGEVFDADGPVDEAVLLVYRAPKSYTGENVAELSCHGGLFIMQKVLRTVLSLGAVPAEAGEFTKRAFLNGKMDLAQAESVMNVIAAQGSAALNAARNTLQGSVSRKIGAVAASLVTAAAGLAAWADYPDEDIPEVENGALLRTVADAEGELNRLIARYDSGKAVTQGVNTVICGKPNVGKSTLMNLLSGYSRSIVTGVAGTTRDVVEETVRVGDLLLRLADTAGLRDTEDEVERIGVSIAKERIDAADLVLAVFDSSRPLTEEDNSLIEQCRGKRCVAVVNKSDLPPAFDPDSLRERLPAVVVISAKDPACADALRAALEQTLGAGGLDFSQEMLAGERQLACARNAAACLQEAREALESGLTVDAVNVSIDCALNELYALTGQKATEETVNEVFRRFCVGK